MAIGCVAIKFPDTEALRALHSLVDGQHESVGPYEDGLMGGQCSVKHEGVRVRTLTHLQRALDLGDTAAPETWTAYVPSTRIPASDLNMAGDEYLSRNSDAKVTREEGMEKESFSTRHLLPRHRCRRVSIRPRCMRSFLVSRVCLLSSVWSTSVLVPGLLESS